MKKYLVTLITAAGLITGCNQSIESASTDFNSLPVAAQKAIRAQAPDAQIASISKTTENGVEAYKVELRQDGKSSQMLVSAEGKVLSSDVASKPAGALQKMMTPTGAVGTKFSALPEAVQKTVLASAPEMEIANISSHEDNGRAIYEVSFKDQGKNPTIRVAEDGTLVQSLQK